jgi:alpha-galactosidase
VRDDSQQVLDSHELGLQAAMTGNYKTLLRAIATDPIVMSIQDAQHIADELLEAEQEELPEYWRRKIMV